MSLISAPGLNVLIIDLASAGARAAVRCNDVIGEVADKIEATAKSYAPVDTGALRDSIGVSRFTMGAVISPSVRYAVFVEAGTSKDPPQAFMGPALDRHSHELEEGIAEAVDL